MSKFGTDQTTSLTFSRVKILSFGDIRKAYTAGVLIYEGFHETQDASVDGTGWLVRKYTWDGADNTRIEQIVGAWSARASLAWGT